MSPKKTKTHTTLVERLRAAAEAHNTSSVSRISWATLEHKMIDAANAGNSCLFLTHDDQVLCSIPNTSDPATRKLVLQAMQTRYVGLRASARRNSKGQDTTPWIIRLAWSQGDAYDGQHEPDCKD